MSKIEKGIIGALAVLLLAGFIAVPAAADDYAYDGYSLVTVENGTFKGDVYASFGSNYGLQTTSYVPNTLQTTYTLPSGNSIEWAKLYTAVWGGKQTYTGWANVTLDGELLGPNERLNKSSPGPNSTCVGNGIWGLEYEVTSVLEDADLGNTVDCIVKAWNTSDSAGIKFDSRIYGAVLVVAYKDATLPKTAYWINDGLLNLNYKSLNEDNRTTFSGPLYKADDEAEVTLGIFAGDIVQPDYGYFNAPKNANSPYTLKNIGWVIENFRDYQLGTNDLADATGNTAKYCDLKAFTATNSSGALKDNLYLVGSNDFIFKRGNDTDGNGKIDSGYYDNPKEGESYYSPFLAILTLKDIWRVYDFSDETPDCNLYAYYNTTFDKSEAGIFDDVDYVNIPFTSTAAIEYDDGVYYTTTAPANGDSAAQRFVFEIDEGDNIQDLNVTWNGKGYDSVAGATMYLWNYTTSTYDQVDTETPGVSTDEFTLNYVTDSPGNYISSSTVHVLIVQNGVTRTTPPPRTISTLETDYVKLEVVPYVA